MTLTIVPVILTPTQYVINGSAGLLFTSNGPIGNLVKKASAANVGSSATTLTLWRVPKGGSTGTSNIITPGVILTPSDFPYIAQELTNMVLENGDSIWGQASASNTITFTMSGFTF